MRFFLVAVVLVLAGCPDLKTSSVPTKCTKQFEKCKLPNGPLGVCQAIKCKAGEQEPCLTCVSQH